MPHSNPRATNLWQAVEKARAINLRWAMRLMRKALIEQIKSILDILPEVIPEQIVNNLREDSIEEAFREIYIKAGIKFGRGVFNSLQKSEFAESAYFSFIDMVMQQQAGDLIKSVTQTTKDRIKRILQIAYAEGLGVPETAKLIQSKLTVMTRTRSISIARTEVIRASNMGAIAGAKMTGLSLKKEWISTIDDRTRAEVFDHLSADGQTVDMDAKFIVSGEELDYPTDFTASPGNTINCRCTVAFKSV